MMIFKKIFFLCSDEEMLKMKYIKDLVDDKKMFDYDEEKEFYRIVERIKELGGSMSYTEYMDLMCDDFSERGYPEIHAYMILDDMFRRHPYAFYIDRYGCLRLNSIIRQIMFWIIEYPYIQIDEIIKKNKDND